jgi:adenine-specific DNA-methyltransferase
MYLPFLATPRTTEWKKVPNQTATQASSKPQAFLIGNRRYIGGKSLLLKAISESIPTELKGGSFCDIFAGTGVVGSSAFSEFEKVTLNDLLFSNETIYKGFYGKGSFSQKKLDEFQAEIALRIGKPIKHNYFSKNFSGKYFSESASKAIGLIRETIELDPYNFTPREKAIALASLIYSADRIANTVGHYEAFRKGAEDFKELEFRLIAPSKEHKAEIFRRDANELARNLKSDVVYVDPPYNSRQYSRFYHVLENLTKWEKPKLKGIALKPPVENISEYCKSRAVDAFEDLIRNLDTKLIVVSYNNTYGSKSSSSRNKITLEEITSILKSKGRTKVKKIPHRHFSAGNTDFDNHLEYLFITAVN